MWLKWAGIIVSIIFWGAIAYEWGRSNGYTKGFDKGRIDAYKQVADGTIKVEKKNRLR